MVTDQVVTDYVVTGQVVIDQVVTRTDDGESSGVIQVIVAGGTDPGRPSPHVTLFAAVLVRCVVQCI